jgi:hypothetical protein
MSALQTCEECRSIERELDQARRAISGNSPNDRRLGERSLGDRMRERYAHLHELAAEETAQAVPPELLDWAKWSHLVAANEPAALGHLRQAVARKFRHEWNTGHTIQLPFQG